MLLKFVQNFIIFLTFCILCEANVRIKGGKDASIHDFPFQVSIRMKKEFEKDFSDGHICGGSLISTRMVLTAAHCRYHRISLRPLPPEHFTVVLGTGNKGIQTNDTLIRNISNIIEMQYPDIAIFVLNQEVQVNPSVTVIDLTNVSSSVGQLCNVSGWGLDPSSSPKVLKYVTIPIQNGSACDFFSEFFNNGSICAGTRNESVCVGDSGGPLVCNGTLHGVVSIGTNPCTGPTVYESVLYHKDWIRRMQRIRRIDEIDTQTTSFGIKVSTSVAITCLSFVLKFIY